MLILRWYMSRVHQPEAPSGADRIVKMTSPHGTRVDVQIDFSTDDLVGTIKDDLHKLRDLHDHLSYWQSDRALEGWTYAQAIFDQVVERNAVTDIKGLPDRTIAEDMVFLQCFSEFRGILDHIWDQYESQKKDSRDPELTWLITEMPHALWLDFTIPARRMAKQIYRSLLADQDTGQEGQTDEI